MRPCKDDSALKFSRSGSLLPITLVGPPFREFRKDLDSYSYNMCLAGMSISRQIT